jgi:hypothetical protein
MRRKKGNLTARDKMFEQIRRLYVYGRLDVETRDQVYPSQAQLAKEFDIPVSTIGSRAKKENWLPARDAAKGKVIDAARQKAADIIIDSLAELRKQDLVLTNGLIEVLATKILAGEVDVSASEGLRAMEFRRKLYAERFGIPEEKPVGVDVKIGVGVQINFDELSDVEQEALHNVVTRTQLRERRAQEIDVAESTEASYVPQLGA